MSRLCLFGLNILNKNIKSFSNIIVPKFTPINNTIIRPFSITPVKLIKEIQVTKEADTLIIDGHYAASPRENLLVKAPEKIVDGKPVCYMCALDLDLKFTDVIILSQFLRSDGCMLPRRITGLCKMQQKKVGKLVAMAQKAGLMINITPSVCKRDPSKRKDWKKFNTYYDEKTIFMRKRIRPFDRFKRR